MAVVTCSEMFGHKKTTKIEAKQREDMISVVLPGHQTSAKELRGELWSSL